MEYVQHMTIEIKLDLKLMITLKFHLFDLNFIFLAT